MAPTIQTQAQREEPGHRPSSHRTLPERSGVVCRVKYCNSLPDIPFDPKFITYPFDQNRFVQYKATSLEKQHKHDLLTEPDLGVTIDLINPDTYRIDPGVLLDPADEKLLEEEIQAPTSSKRSQQHAKVVPWMRKTEYISTEFNRYGVSNEKPEVKIGVSVKQQFTEEEIYKDRDSQIAAIEKTFEDAQKAITQHYSKPRVTPIEVMPVFPDFKMWINPCAQVIFDSDPAPKDTSGAAALEMMSQAMIRGMMDEEGNQFVAYFLPVEETLRKRKRDQEEEMDYAPEDVYDYKIAREYNWNVKNKASKGYEENYFFIFREGDGVYYNELETRRHGGRSWRTTSLRKRRRKRWRLRRRQQAQMKSGRKAARAREQQAVMKKRRLKALVPAAVSREVQPAARMKQKTKRRRKPGGPAGGAAMPPALPVIRKKSLAVMMMRMKKTTTRRKSQKVEAVRGGHPAALASAPAKLQMMRAPVKPLTPPATDAGGGERRICAPFPPPPLPRRGEKGDGGGWGGWFLFCFVFFLILFYFYL
uniref:RNA polymerase II-associated factor 1 homolog n=1 Tax=Phasianus colchicus TaxID=9054 RepID=A0A669QHQ7_PHACC